jgi:hypothetical protein
MPDYKKMTLERLRELARSLLGPGQSKKTKAALVAALEGAGKATPSKPAKARVGAVGKAARAAAEKVGAAAREGVKAVKAAARAGKAAATKAAPAGKKSPPKARARKAAKPAASVPAASAPHGPDPDGFFVARIRGEEAMREAPYPMTETAPGGGWHEDEPRGAAVYDEKLGDLPWSYGDDAFVALPRDPSCLFLYWDFAGPTISRGLEGLDHPRTQLWIQARGPGGGWDRVRVVDFALESRGFYVHDLEPGRVYRAEIHVVDRGGRERLLGAPSNECGLPPVGPSPIVDDRFIRIPWDLPLGKLLGPGHPGAPFPDDIRAMLARLSDWARFSGPTWGGSAGGMGGRPSSPTSSPSGPGRER